MPRKPREEEAGAVHHVYARGAKQAVIYRDDEDRSRYLAMLGRAVVDQGLRCLSYCLMDNHVHLVIETPRANLGVGMHRAHGPFAQSFNRRHGTSGHVFQGRYNAKRVRSDAQFWTLAAYVARNPVAAGLCERPEQWRWSSHAATLGVGGVAPAWLDVGRTLELFSSAGGDPRERYAAFVGA
jgi:REP element-mobilizing transposase RayT